MPDGDAVSVSFYAENRRASSMTLRGMGAKRAYERVEIPDAYDFNWSNGNAAKVLALLGLASEDLAGETSIEECRRAVIKATARLNGSAQEYTRPEYVEYGSPRENEDGTVELKPVRILSFGLDEAGLKSRVDCFSQYVEVAANAGATHVMWG
jgi:hypothetical protein